MDGYIEPQKLMVTKENNNNNKLLLIYGHIQKQILGVYIYS